MLATGCSFGAVEEEVVAHAAHPRPAAPAHEAVGAEPRPRWRAGQDPVEQTDDAATWPARTWDTLAADYGRFYSSPRLLGLGVAIGLAGVSANSQLDRDIYEDAIAGWRTDDYDRFGQAVTGMGEGLYAIPTFGVAALAGASVGLPGVGEWGERSLRALAVGAPPLLFLQSAIGAGRPDDPANNDTSEWKPFQHANGVSGHAFIGSVSWLTAARMVENPYAAAGLGAGSLLVPAARLQGDRHYFSQVALGWFLAYLCTGAVADADAGETTTVMPMVDGDTVGLLFQHRF